MLVTLHACITSDQPEVSIINYHPQAPSPKPQAPSPKPQAPSPKPPMRYLAIDLGDKRTGLAMGTDVTRQAEPIAVVEAKDDTQRLRAIAEAIEDYGPGALVLGLPLNMDGTEGPRRKLAQAFAAKLQEQFHLPVHLMDERLSSEAANAEMAQTGLTRQQKKQRRDAVAAAMILRDFFLQAQR